MNIKAVLLLSVSIMLAACTDTPSESSSENKKDNSYTIVDSVVTAKSKLIILTYNQEIKSNEEIKELSKKITNNAISDGFKNIALYFFNEESDLPDLNGVYDYMDATDYLYDGSHNGWNYIYQHPIIGSPRLINCSVNEHTVCK